MNEALRSYGIINDFEAIRLKHHTMVQKLVLTLSTAVDKAKTLLCPSSEYVLEMEC